MMDVKAFNEELTDVKTMVDKFKDNNLKNKKDEYCA